MPRRKSITCRENMIALSSSSSDVDVHESLGTDQEQEFEAQTLTHDASSSSAMPQHRGGSFHSRIYLPTSTRPSG